MRLLGDFFRNERDAGYFDQYTASKAIAILENAATVSRVWNSVLTYGVADPIPSKSVFGSGSITTEAGTPSPYLQSMRLWSLNRRHGYSMRFIVEDISSSPAARLPQTSLACCFTSAQTFPLGFTS